MNHMTANCDYAPWNQEDPMEVEKEVIVRVTLSKTLKIYNSDQENLYSDVEDQVVLPQNLAMYTEAIFNEDLDLKAAGMPKYLQNAIKDCKDWEVDEMEVIEE